MPNFSQFGPVVSSDDGLGTKKGHSIFYYEYTCRVYVLIRKEKKLLYFFVKRLLYFFVKSPNLLSN